LELAPTKIQSHSFLAHPLVMTHDDTRRFIKKRLGCDCYQYFAQISLFSSSDFNIIFGESVQIAMLTYNRIINIVSSETMHGHTIAVDLYEAILPVSCIAGTTLSALVKMTFKTIGFSILMGYPRLWSNFWEFNSAKR
jgi:hypothetical protein